VVDALCWKTTVNGKPAAPSSIPAALRAPDDDAMIANQTIPMRRMPQRPSLLYGATCWKAGTLLAKTLPPGVLKWTAASISSVYGRVFARRREVVIQNLIPLVSSRDAAKRAAGRLFRNFGEKLIDLWRFEARVEDGCRFSELTGWQHFLEAQKLGRGVLIVTPHLGNWEFGAPLLTRHGFKLIVITLVEPGHGLTEIRQNARARWGIETIVIGRDPFAFVEVIRKLEAGATVALLIDRPPASSAVEVELCGRPFRASVAAAELARATHCEILPVCLPSHSDSYAGHILPRIDYDRSTLRDPRARQQLTQRILSALEPSIREHSDQWYHFVPVWR
jgi:lauroyl/myristoyl acyltransferase